LISMTQTIAGWTFPSTSWSNNTKSWNRGQYFLFLLRFLCYNLLWFLHFLFFLLNDLFRRWLHYFDYFWVQYFIDFFLEILKFRHSYLSFVPVLLLNLLLNWLI
jgi:hypothetical protein